MSGRPQRALACLPRTAVWIALLTCSAAAPIAWAGSEGDRLLAAGRAQEAADAYARVLESSSDPAAVEGRVRALLALERWPQALEEARAHASRAPGRPRVVSALAEALFRAGRLAEAEQALEGLGPEVRTHARALWTLSRLRGASGAVEEALELVEHALTHDPDAAELHWWAAEVALSRAASVAHLERFIALVGSEDTDRAEAARGSIALFRRLEERPIWVSASRPERMEVPLRPVWNDQGRRLGYVISVRLGERDRPVRLLLDTGSPGLFLTRRIARKHGFEPLSETTTFGGGGDRRHRSTRGILSRFELGSLAFVDALATTTAAELEPQGRFHGVVGLSLFNGYRVTFDLPRKRLLLEPGSNEVSGARYWTCAAQMLVRVTAEAGGSGLFLFDTGASWSVVSASFVESVPGARLGAPADVRTYGGLVPGARFVHGLQLEFEGLRAGGEVRAVDLSLRSRLTGAEVSGYLGLDLLDGGVLVVDTVARRVRIARPGAGQRRSTPSARSASRGAP